jgi:hypothetical protein
MVPRAVGSCHHDEPPRRYIRGAWSVFVPAGSFLETLRPQQFTTTQVQIAEREIYAGWDMGDASITLVQRAYTQKIGLVTILRIVVIPFQGDSIRSSRGGASSSPFHPKSRICSGIAAAARALASHTGQKKSRPTACR